MTTEPRLGRGRFAVLATAGLVALALVKFWPMVRPWERVYFTMDLSLGIEGHFYALLKRGTAFLWDPTVVTGNLTIGGGLHHPQYGQALFRMSSELPPKLSEAARAEGFAVREKARGVVINADPTALVRFLDIGTRVSTGGAV